MLLINLVSEEMDFRIQIQAVFPHLAVLALQLKEHPLGKMGRKEEGPLQQSMISRGLNRDSPRRGC